MDPVFTTVEQVIADASTETVPALLGELERLKALAWGKLLTNGHGSANGPDVAKEDLLTMAQVAKRLNVKPSYAYELARLGKLRSLRMGKYLRVTEQALADYQAHLARK
jgi:excisionase family DNA binding protein